MKNYFCLAVLLLIPGLSLAEDTKSTEQPPAENSAPKTTVAKPEASAAATPVVINCDYKLPSDKTADQTLLSTWGERAAVQSFSFKPDALDAELEALQKCYTKSGWKAFNEALKTSGNLEAIRTNKLVVTSEVKGQAQVKGVKENQWKVSVPLQVTYQNQEKQLVQNLDVDLLVALNKSGMLGIMQVIAVPKQGKNPTT